MALPVSFPPHRRSASCILGALSVAACLHVGAARAEQLAVLYSFTGGADGALPTYALTSDVNGTLYGTTQEGGDYQCTDGGPVGCGTIFRLDQQHTLTPLHAFAGGAQGFRPTIGVSLIRGRLYGGAAASALARYDVVYSINTDGSLYTIVHAFSSADGVLVQGAIQPSFNGGEFGIAKEGGSENRGTLFYIGPEGRFQVLLNFGGARGADPNELLQDQAGNLYGSTTVGGMSGWGVVFEYSQSTHTYQVLYSFQNAQDGERPLLGAVDANGVLYGVTQSGGAYNNGALFSISPAGSNWTFKVLAPIQSPVHSDQASIPPTLSATGALVGGTGFGGIYTYQNGQFTIKAESNGSLDSQFLIPHAHPGAIVGSSSAGGTAPCAVPAMSQCGFIFAGRH